MSFLSRLNSAFEVKGYQPTQGLTVRQPLDLSRFDGPTPIGNEITFYPADGGERYLTYGYNLNDAVNSIVGKNTRKAGQVRMTHCRVKKEERKTLQEFNRLASGTISAEVFKELKIMRKAMIEDYVIDSPLTKLLNKPNRNQTQSEWIELLFGLRELQGEGNLWLNRNLNGQIIEMMPIPKPHVNIVGNGNDPWEIVRYQFVLNGNTYDWDKKDVVMWKYSNPMAITTTLEHLRGRAPLQALMVLIQAMNEGDERVAISNANAGAAGFAFRKDLKMEPTLEQRNSMRSQFNDIVNNADMANKIAVLGGEWGYYNIGRSMEELKILEQHNLSFQRVANAFETPHQLFGYGNDTYENQKQYGRSWIYGKIAPNMYNLRGLLSERLLPEFKLDPETNLIDCDIMSLPEMSIDLKERTEALKNIWQLTPNQVLKELGYEPSEEPAMDKIYAPTGLTPIEEMSLPAGTGVSLEEEQLLNQ